MGTWGPFSQVKVQDLFLLMQKNRTLDMMYLNSFSMCHYHNSIHGGDKKYRFWVGK